MTITSSRKMMVLSTIEGFFSTWALMKASRMEPGNIFTGIFFFLCAFAYYHILKRVTPLIEKRERIVSVLLSLCFTLCYMFVDYHYYIEALTNRGFQFIILTAVFLGFMVLFYNLLLCIFSYTKYTQCLMNRITLSTDTGVTASSASPVKKSFHTLNAFFRKHTLLCSFCICLLCWLPYFLYEFPGIMTPDSINQYEQVLNVIPHSNHHPWVHTMLIRLLYSIGSLFTSNIIIAASFYTFFQMCIMALVAAYLISTLSIYRIKPLYCYLVLVFYALVPYNAVFAVTVWKDILFAGAVLTFTLTMFRMLSQSIPSKIVFSRFQRMVHPVLYFISGLAICLFRSNGWYAFLISLPFLLFGFRKSWKTMVPLQLGIVLITLLVRGPVMTAFHVVQPDFVESISIPVQQIAAVICKDEPLTEEQWNQIHKIIDTTYIKELYDPSYADNIKELVRAGDPVYLEEHKSEYLKLWLTLGMSYPGDYFQSYVSQTYGYWYPDSFYHVADTDGVSGTDLGIIHTPLIRGTLVIKAKEIAIKLGSMVPLYSLLWSMGIIFWIVLFCAGNSIVRKEYQKLLCYLPTIAIFLTVMIATPVAYEFRYVYFMVYSLPCYLFITLYKLDCNV